MYSEECIAFNLISASKGILHSIGNIAVTGCALDDHVKNVSQFVELIHYSKDIQDQLISVRDENIIKNLSNSEAISIIIHGYTDSSQSGEQIINSSFLRAYETEL